jgi:hypothetical protein
MSVTRTTCPNLRHLRLERYNGKLAQVPNAIGDIVCMGCGADHTSPIHRTASEIAADIRQHLIRQGVNLK